MGPSNPSSHVAEHTSTNAEPSVIPITSEDENGVKNDAEEVKSGERKAWPENSGEWSFCRCLHGIYTRWSYSYMNPILRKGRRQFKDGEHLTPEDLYEVPDDMRSELLVANFWNYYKEAESLVSVLLKLVAPAFVPAGFWELIYVTCRISLPLSLRQLLLALEENPAESIVQKGLPYAILLTVATLLAALSQNRMVFLSTKSGIMLRAALTSAIYEHALRLTPAGRVGLTTGEVTNLVAVDTQKLFDVMLEGHNIWSCPLLICVVTVLLGVMIGPELMVGVAALILFLPVVQVIVERMLRIRKERSKLTDVRINLITSMLQGIRVTKLNHYESKIEQHVGAIRDKEMKLLRRELSMWGWVLSSAVCSPLVATAIAFSFFALVDEDNLITPSNAFTALLLFSILRFPINMTARLVGKMAQAIDALRRISRFLARDVRPYAEIYRRMESSNVEHSDRPLIDIRDGAFTIKPQDDLLAVSQNDEESVSDAESEWESAPQVQTGFTIRSLTFQVKQSEVIAVVGKVGAGKTLLLRALLGEVPSVSGTQFNVEGTISYAAQQPFILNTSLRENILFGSEYHDEHYENALDACCLRQDVQHLGPAGDLTQIGERGVTLSGGQKQRVALARAIYARPDIALLDDCFSALDANTASAVFDGLFGFQDEKILHKTGTVLVTHAIHFLPRVDKILVMSDGVPSFFGSWKELQDRKGRTDEVLQAIQFSGHGQKYEKKRRGFGGKLRQEGVVEKDGFIMTVEEREYGVASLDVWLRWFRNAGGWRFVFLQFVFLVLDRGLYVASDWWLATWSDAAYVGTTSFGHEFPPQSEGRSAQSQYVITYAVIIVLSAFAAMLRSQWAVAGGARCADRMFTAMTHSVLRAPMSYFETTPLGRVLNRFTYDVEVLDIELSVSMTGLMISFSWLLSSIVVMAVVLPWIIIGLVPVCVVYFFIQLYYRMSGPDLQRIDAMSRSPIQASLAEGLEGSTTIRAFRKERKFASSFRNSVDQNSSAMLNFLSAQRWLGVRIEVLGASMTFAITIIIVCANGFLKIEAGMVGLVVQWSVVFSAALNFFFLRLSESEARITSIERIHQTTILPQEAAWETDPSIDLDSAWPSTGELEFDNVCMRYRESLPLALDTVSFKLKPGMRCGVVGRTGSGKTSLTAALFRLVEIESGRILLDGVELAKLGLADVRGRSNGLCIIPQDPVLFAGTLRDCLDPFKCATDDKILEALQAVDHKGARERGRQILNDSIDEDGANYSVGERQLLCLARAIVEEPRVLVLDEATASVDSTTDSFIQHMLRTRFKNTTMLTIAHRLHTIMDYDTILVMEDGHCLEFGTPKVLLENAEGILTSFVDATGPESAAELRKIAADKDGDTK